MSKFHSIIYFTNTILLFIEKNVLNIILILRIILLKCLNCLEKNWKN